MKRMHEKGQDIKLEIDLAKSGTPTKIWYLP